MALRVGQSPQFPEQPNNETSNDGILQAARTSLRNMQDIARNTLIEARYSFQKMQMRTRHSFHYFKETKSVESELFRLFFTAIFSLGESLKPPELSVHAYL